MHIAPIADSELASALGLLADAALPLLGASEAMRHGLAAREGDALIGVAAVEPYGPVALLRSVAVRPAERGRGVGRALVSSAEDVARDLGVRELFLLTETAEPWFAAMGYRSMPRQDMPPDILDSGEVRFACAASAVAMRRTL